MNKEVVRPLRSITQIDADFPRVGTVRNGFSPPAIARVNSRGSQRKK